FRIGAKPFRASSARSEGIGLPGCLHPRRLPLFEATLIGPPRIRHTESRHAHVFVVAGADRGQRCVSSVWTFSKVIGVTAAGSKTVRGGADVAVMVEPTLIAR